MATPTNLDLSELQEWIAEQIDESGDHKVEGEYLDWYVTARVWANYNEPREFWHYYAEIEVCKNEADDQSIVWKGKREWEI